jgi:hypothetical protein
MNFLKGPLCSEPMLSLKELMEALPLHIKLEKDSDYIPLNKKSRDSFLSVEHPVKETFCLFPTTIAVNVKKERIGMKASVEDLSQSPLDLSNSTKLKKPQSAEVDKATVRVPDDIQDTNGGVPCSSSSVRTDKDARSGGSNGRGRRDEEGLRTRGRPTIYPPTLTQNLLSVFNERPFVTPLDILNLETQTGLTKAQIRVRLR